MSVSSRDSIPVYPCTQGKRRTSAGAQRRFSRWMLVLTIAVFVAVLAGGGLLPLPGSPSHGLPAHAAAGPDQVIVKFKSNASESAIQALNFSMASQQVDALPPLGIRIVRVPFGRSAEVVAAAYARNPLVEFAEVNALVEPEVIPDDPNYSKAWHLAKIEAPAAWDETKATGVMIAVCDTGVASVPDLTPVLRGDLGWNAASNSNDWSPISGHGTLVAGAAAAATNNGTGNAGVAWGAQIVPVRITNQTGGSAYVSDAAKCITYAADQGARVANLSYRMAGYATIDSAGAYGRNKGMVTLVAAGNDGIDPGWPNYPSFLAVGATNSSDLVPSFSNHGEFLDLGAPGYNVYTTRQDGSYGPASGTSLAAPVAAGVVALIFGANPALTAAQAENILLNAADDLGNQGWDAYYGQGRVNASKAVTAALTGGGAAPLPTPTATSTLPAPTLTPTPTLLAPTPTATSTLPAPTATTSPTWTPSPSPTPTATPPPSPSPAPNDMEPPVVTLVSPAASVTVRGNLTVSAQASDNVAVARVVFYVDGKFVASDSVQPYAVTWNASKAGKGNHTIVAVAYDVSGNAASDSIVVTVR